MEMRKKEIRKRPVVTNAVLKVKCIHHTMNPESTPFEDYITSANTSIKIDFPDGRCFMEKEFRSHAVLMDKFYIEFFEEVPMDNLMDYLTNEQSNFRVTSFDGSIIRLCHDDYESIPKELKEFRNKKPLKEFVFVEEKPSFFQKIKRGIHKKEK